MTEETHNLDATTPDLVLIEKLETLKKIFLEKKKKNLVAIKCSWTNKIG